jgi:exodeoxyribonuclease VII large subunit
MFEAQQPVSLRTLNRIISGVIRQQFGFQRYWVQAEITSFKINRGHCYLQLIEKEELTDNICAEAKGIIWANQAGSVLAKFERETGIALRDQLQVLCMVEVNFHERFGMSLIIHEIDAAFTLGKLEQARRKTIQQLKAEGVYDLNKQLQIPEVIQRIAVISSADAKGFEDFVERLHNHDRGFRFDVKLFAALVQGNQAPGEIISCLLQIQKEEAYDAVIIVRGGGSITDLECFNDYALAREVALCTLPVITGIGHSTNRSICDEVAAVDCITPTDVAYFLLNKMEVFEDECNHLAEGIIAYTNSILATEESSLNEMIFSLKESARRLKQEADTDLQQLSFQLRESITTLTSAGKEWLMAVQMRAGHAVSTSSHHARYELENYLQRIINSTQQTIRISDTDLLNTENKVRLTDPEVILRRGYSYTLVNGKSLTKKEEVVAGDELTTVVSNGRIKSIAIDEK